MGDELAYLPTVPGKSAPAQSLTTLQKAELIRGLEIFSQATVEELYSLASIAQEVALSSQQILFHENDISEAFYLVVQGRVDCSSEARDSHSSVGPGEAAGLYSALTREPRYMTAKAVEHTLVLSIGAEDLFNLLANNTEIIVSIFKHFVNKLGVAPQE